MRGENHRAEINHDVNHKGENLIAQSGNEYVEQNVDMLSESLDKQSEKTTTSVDNKFSVDYSKRGTAKCKLCKNVIAKSEIRIGKSVPFKATYITQFHHVNCAFKKIQKARVASNVIKDVTELDSFDSIMNTDKVRISELIEKGNVASMSPLPEGYVTKKMVSIKAPLKPRISWLQSTNLPSINVLFTNAGQLTSSKTSELSKQILVEKPMVISSI